MKNVYLVISFKLLKNKIEGEITGCNTNVTPASTTATHHQYKYHHTNENELFHVRARFKISPRRYEAYNNQISG